MIWILRLGPADLQRKVQRRVSEAGDQIRQADLKRRGSNKRGSLTQEEIIEEENKRRREEEAIVKKAQREFVWDNAKLENKDTEAIWLK